MRRLASLGWSVCGLALLVTSTASAGGKSGHLCPNCQLQKAIRDAGNAPLVINNAPGADLMPPAAPCLTCAPGSGGEAPGYASLAGPTPYPGGTILSTEPAPLGVVRAGFHQQYQGAPAALAPGLAAAPGHAVGPQVPPAPTGWVPRRTSRPSVIAHLFGLDGFGRRRAERAERAASEHAALRLGMPPEASAVTGLPAAAVYGNGPR